MLAVIPGARTEENGHAIVEEVERRLGGEPPVLMTSDEDPVYETAIRERFGEPVPEERGPGRPRVVPERRVPEGVVYATVHKHREKGRFVAVEPRLVFGSEDELEEALSESCSSYVVNTSFVERQNATDRHRNARKGRKTYRFSKDWQVHEAMTYLTLYGYNFCWCVRTLRVKGDDGRWRARTPAVAAGLTDHVWPVAELLWWRPPCPLS
ncbi:MAG TPA: hypothetical protein VLR69_10795 [Thermoanaerobaculia bacterium]|nr:hypothetical protein [Thermoanaerobaculia bacterium]